MKRYANDILHLDRSTFEIKPDGSITITPRPLPTLPNEILFIILSHYQYDLNMLHHCALVNKVFYSLANPLLWKTHANYHMNTERFLTSISDAPPQRLRTLLQYTPRLHLKNPHWTDIQLLRMVPHLSRLQYLYINKDATITDASFQNLPYHCHQQLVRILLETPHLTRTSFDAVGQYCHQLTSFMWQLFQGQSPDWLVLLVQCPLQKLTISSTSTSWDTNSLSILKSWHHLTHLSMHFGNSPHDMKSLLVMASTTTTTTDIWWPHLTYLSLGPCDAIDDTTLIAFIKSHPHLENITIEDNNQLTDTSIDAMAKWHPKLRTVHLLGNLRIYPRAILQLIKQCQYLEAVYICDRRHLVSPSKVVDVEPNKSNHIVGCLNMDTIKTIKQREF